MKEFSLDGFQTIQHTQYDGIMSTFGKLPDGEYIVLSCVKADFYDPEPRMIKGEVSYLGTDAGALVAQASGPLEDLLKHIAACPSLIFEFQNEAMGRELQAAAQAAVH